MARSIPPGNEGNIPRGRLMFLTLSSQKQRGHSKKRLSVEGDNLIEFIYLFKGLSLKPKPNTGEIAESAWGGSG
jgi:hypothetical protein